MEAAIAGPLNASGTVRGRLLGAADAREGSLDRYFKQRAVGFGALEVDLGDSTLLNLGISYQETDADNVSWGGLPPWYSTGALIDWPWGFNLGTDWTSLDTQRTEAFASLEHVFANGWTGRLVATRVVNDFQGQLGWFPPGTDANGNLTFPDPQTGLGVVGLGVGEVRRRLRPELAERSAERRLPGARPHPRLRRRPVRLEGRQSYRRLQRRPRGQVDRRRLRLGRQLSRARLARRDRTGYYDTETSQAGLYGTTQFHATDALAIIGGARVNWWEGSASDSWGGDNSYSFEGIVTPYLGFTYDINETWTAYGSVTSIYKP